MQQFTQWIMTRPELLREKMKEQKDTEQTSWVRTASFMLSTLSNLVCSGSSHMGGIETIASITSLMTIGYIDYQKPLRAINHQSPSRTVGLDVQAKGDAYPNRSMTQLPPSKTRRKMAPKLIWKIIFLEAWFGSVLP